MLTFHKPATCAGVTQAFTVHRTASRSQLKGTAGICEVKCSAPTPTPTPQALMDERCLLGKYPILSACC